MKLQTTNCDDVGNTPSSPWRGVRGPWRGGLAKSRRTGGRPLRALCVQANGCWLGILPVFRAVTAPAVVACLPRYALPTSRNEVHRRPLAGGQHDGRRHEPAFSTPHSLRPLVTGGHPRRVTHHPHHLWRLAGPRRSLLGVRPRVLPAILSPSVTNAHVCPPPSFDPPKHPPSPPPPDARRRGCDGRRRYAAAAVPPPPPPRTAGAPALPIAVCLYERDPPKAGGRGGGAWP